MGPVDAPFVFSGWVESFRSAHAAGPIPSDMYRTLYREILRRVLDRSRVVVAYNLDRPTQLFGFAVRDREDDQERPVLHYVFVKQFFRRNGVARYLVQELGISTRDPFVYTFKSQAAKTIARKWTGGCFDPMVVRRATTLKGAEETL